MAFFSAVLPRKPTLPCLCHDLPARGKFVSPNVFGFLQSATRRVFPFRFCWEFAAGPCRIGAGIFIRDLHDRVILSAFNRATFAFRMLPAGPGNKRPPIAHVPQINRAFCHIEDHRSGHQQKRVCAGKIGRVKRPFSNRHISGFGNELRKLCVGDRAPINPKSVNCGFADWGFIRIMSLRPHMKAAALYPNHVVIMIFRTLAKAIRWC